MTDLRTRFAESAALEPLAVERERYAALVGAAFSIAEAPPGRIDLELVAVSPLRESAGQETFSLEFLGPAAAPLGQGIQTLEHEAGPSVLFLVPLGIEGSRVRYEAVFTRLVASHRDRAGEQGGMGA